MRLLLTTLTPIGPDLLGAPSPVQAIPDFLAAGHELFLAAPVVGRATEVRAALGLSGLLPLFRTGERGWLPLLANSYRFAFWARRWEPELYLSVGARAATLAHGGRGSAGGKGLALLVLPGLRYLPDGGIGAFVERRAIHECDRLVTHDEALARHLLAQHGARGGDLAVLPADEPHHWRPLCERYLAEPPGFN